MLPGQSTQTSPLASFSVSSRRVRAQNSRKSQPKSISYFKLLFRRAIPTSRLALPGVYTQSITFKDLRLPGVLIEVAHCSCFHFRRLTLGSNHLLLFSNDHCFQASSCLETWLVHPIRKYLPQPALLCVLRVHSSTGQPQSIPPLPLPPKLPFARAHVFRFIVESNTV